MKWSESRSVLSDSATPRTIHTSRWNSPGKNTGVGSFPSSRGSSQPRDRTQVSSITGGFFTSWATREAQEYWCGQPFPSPRDLLNLRIEPRSSALQADSLTPEPPGKPKNTGVGSLSLLQQIFMTQELNQGLLHCRWLLYHLSHQESPENQRLKLYQMRYKNMTVWTNLSNRRVCV